MANGFILYPSYQYVKSKNVILYKFHNIVLHELANNEYKVYNG